MRAWSGESRVAESRGGEIEEGIFVCEMEISD